MTTGQYVDVKMRDCFAGQRTIVDDRAETILETQLQRHITRYQKQVTEQSRIALRGDAQMSDHTVGNHQQMQRRLRIDIPDDDALIVPELNLGGNLAVSDLLENRLVGHGREPVTEP